MSSPGRAAKRLEYLRAKFEKAGIRPTRKLGQNFLLDRNQVLKVCRDAQINPLDTVLEVGPGSGLLSTALAAAGAALVCVELDRKLIHVVRDELEAYPNATVMEGDILESKSELNREALALVQSTMQQRGHESLKCISNLPYSVATPFIANLCADPMPWQCGVFMIQYEVAERLVADPGCSDYGSLSVVCNLACKKVKILRPVPPQVFWPRPKVKSAIVKLDFKSPEERTSIEWEQLRRLTNAVFAARRKNLRNAFKGFFRNAEGDRSELMDEFFKKLDLDPTARAEKFAPAELLRIARELPEEPTGKSRKIKNT